MTAILALVVFGTIAYLISRKKEDGNENGEPNLQVVTEINSAESTSSLAKQNSEVGNNASDFMEGPDGSFGIGSRSPDNTYTLILSDFSGDRGGARSRGHGKCILYAGKKRLVTGKAERPNDPAVANNGTFVFNDYLFDGKGPRGEFVAIDVSGKELLRRRLKANLLTNGIDPTGRFAVCQTANADVEGGSLFMFDLITGVELMFPRESGHPEQTGLYLSYRGNQHAKGKDIQPGV